MPCCVWKEAAEQPVESSSYSRGDLRNFDVPGRPYPQGSLSSFKSKNGPIVTPQKPSVLMYRADIQTAWGEPSPVAGPVHIALVFYFLRPKSPLISGSHRPVATKCPDKDDPVT